MIAAGSTHALAMRVDGSILAWGDNQYGQVGNGMQTLVYPSATAVPPPIASFSSLTSVAAGRSHSIAVKANGDIWTWGRNHKGQLGDGTIVTRSQPAKSAFKP
jgi:alpha-tubulin suppressor-like RCC1 family protein